MTIDNPEDEGLDFVLETSYDHQEIPPSLAVIEAVAAASNTPASELTPLHSKINTDALDDIFKPTNTPETRLNGKLQFTYEDYIILIDNGTQHVRLYESSEEKTK